MWGFRAARLSISEAFLGFKIFFEMGFERFGFCGSRFGRFVRGLVG